MILTCVNLLLLISSPLALITAVSCSHFRPVRMFLTLYYQTSRRFCQPIAYECRSYKAFLAGQCASCSHNRCTYVGYEEQIGRTKFIRDIPLVGHNKMMFIKTDSEPPFCCTCNM